MTPASPDAEQLVSGMERNEGEVTGRGAKRGRNGGKTGVVWINQSINQSFIPSLSLG